MTSEQPAVELDALVFGGGVAGLWCLHALVESGCAALLLESARLGEGQTIQSQGIVHGGGKYALRAVRDFSAVEAIREMPQRWWRSLRAQQAPDLSGCRVLSDHCLLWDRRREGVLGKLAGTLLPVVARSGLLATRPEPVAPEHWPPLLAGAGAVYRMAEPVLATRTLVSALAEGQRAHIRAYSPGEDARQLQVERQPDGRWRVEAKLQPQGPATVLLTSVIICCAGAGNQALAGRIPGAAPLEMQRRPLHMALLRGALPELHGHWVEGGRTRLTITSADIDEGARVWALGGQLAEEGVGQPAESVIEQACRELALALPGLELGGVEAATYLAVRAEAASALGVRPSGVHVATLAEGAVAAWPTKLALAPVLADALVDEVRRRLERLGRQAQGGARETAGRQPELACYPWEEARWSPVR